MLHSFSFTSYIKIMTTTRILAWGCGVQSTTLAAMAAHREIPPFDAIITASHRPWGRVCE